MYKCSKCRELFTEDEMLYTEELCPTDRGMQHLLVDGRCPHCGSYNYDEVYECPICGEFASIDYDEPCESCMDEILYWTANCMANIMAWMPNINKQKANDLIEEAMWRLLKNEEDIKYLDKVIGEKRNGND